MDIIYLILTNLRRLLKNKKLLTLIILLFLLLNLFSFFNNVFGSTGNVERDNIIKNNFYYLKQYVNDKYGYFKDYCIVDQRWLDRLFYIKP